MVRTKQTARKSTGGKAPRKQYITESSNDSDAEVTEQTLFIRNSLQSIFKQDLSFCGSFASHRAYPEAPNPCLNVKGVGAVGLPLHVRDAEAIKARAEQAPFGKATKTVVDKSVRDTWEIDGKQVQFDNRAWAPFMDQVVRSVCGTLGVNYDASQPRCELYKLLLYEKGSHFKAHVDTEKANGMFATIVIVLPSKFNGGAIHVSHGDSSDVFDCSANSHTDITVLAWYMDVQHEVKRVTSGYRLALSFNLIHTTKSLRPALSSQSNTANRLREVLTSWRDGDGGPNKIIYLLSHKYSQANLSGSAMKGADAHLVSTLESVARPLGFKMGLANLMCTEHGYGDGMSDCDEVSMIEVEETTVEIENLVDLSGKLIQESFEYNVRQEAIPDKFAREITSGEYDDQDDHGGYTGNEGTTIDRFYHRTVVVIWPSWAHYNIVYGEKALSRACEELYSSTTTSPTSDEKQLVQFILNRMNADDDDDNDNDDDDYYDQVVFNLPLAACRWKDLALWTKTMNKCLPHVGLSLFVEGSINTAVETFGFKAIKPWIENALKEDEPDLAILNFLDRFESWITDNLPGNVVKPIKDWIRPRWTHRLNNLTSPGIGHCGMLVDLLLKHADVDFFEKKILPQIKLLCEPAELPKFAEALYDGTSYLPSRVLAWPETFWLSLYRSSREYRSPSEVVTSFIETCLHCRCEDLLPKVLDRLMQPEYGIETVLPVLVCLGDAVRSHLANKVPPDLIRFARWAVSSYLEVIDTSAERVSASEIIPVCEALEAVGQAGLIESQLLPHLEAVPMPSYTLKALLDQLHSKGDDIGLDKGPMKVLMTRLVKKYATIIDFHPRSWSYVSGTEFRLEAALDALKYCLEVGAPDACAEVLRRFLAVPGGLNTGFLQSSVLPLLKKLHPLLKKHKLRITVDAIAAPLRSLLVDWVGTVMGPRPEDGWLAPLGMLDKWTCTCVHCLPVRGWLLESSEANRTFPNLGATNRKHIEKFLKAHASNVATWYANNFRPQGLVVNRSEELIKPMRWKEHQSEGKKLLDAISTDAQELQTILGSDYATVVVQLGVDAPVASRAANAAPEIRPNALAGPSGSGSSGKTTTNTTKKKRPKETASGSQPRPQPRKRTKKDATGEADVIDLT